MLALVSPAKKLDFPDQPDDLPFTQPAFINEGKTLVKTAGALSRAELKRLMKLSDNLTDLNFQRFKAFAPPFTPANARQAIMAFRGDTYIGLDADTLNQKDLAYAQDHLGILSGLYGLLRPLDLVQPYRLEMGTRLATDQGGDLYAFWGEKITQAINNILKLHEKSGEAAIVVNLASNEYFKSVKPGKLNGRLITPVFKEDRDGESRVISLMAKRARGMMARYIIQTRATDAQALKKFNGGGYKFQPHASDDDTWVFTRPQPDKKS